MKFIREEEFINNSVSVLSNMYGDLRNLSNFNIEEVEPKKTLVFSIDVNNGFAREGAMSSPRVGELIEESARVLNELAARGVQVVAYTDTHTKNSPEFAMYPEHCLEGSSESEVVDEIKSIDNIVIKPKMSTNGFLAYNPLKQDEMNYENLTQEDLDSMDTFIVTGDCTDICIYQFVLSLKTYLDQCNRRGTVIVPIDLVDTFDAPFHNADFMNIVFLSSMAANGVKLVSKIKC